MILDMIRTATEPLSTNTIAKKLVFNKGISDNENFDLERFKKIIFASLERCEKNELIERVGKDGLAILWQIKA